MNSIEIETMFLPILTYHFIFSKRTTILIKYKYCLQCGDFLAFIYYVMGYTYSNGIRIELKRVSGKSTKQEC